MSFPPHHSFLPSAWAEKRGYKTAKAARNDVYRAANSLLRLALDGRLSLCFHPPGYLDQKGHCQCTPTCCSVGNGGWWHSAGHTCVCTCRPALRGCL